MRNPSQPPVQFRQSTTLASAGNDPSRAELRVDFCDGSRYAYSEVPLPLFVELLGAPSQGSFFNRQVRGRFPYVKVVREN